MIIQRIRGQSASHPSLQVSERVRQNDVEDGVRAAALLVHVRGRHSAGFIPLRHQGLNVLWVEKGTRLGSQTCFNGQKHCTLMHTYFLLKKKKIHIKKAKKKKHSRAEPRCPEYGL